jgi:predicted metal-dependent phosphoesterase TrpH
MSAFDLQSHSIASDGALSPADVVARAAAAGIELLALSDHDTVDGVEEALLAARTCGGITVTPATELSAVDGIYEDLHVLGYEIDHRSVALKETLADFRADRERRIWQMADRMRELGFELDDSALRRRQEEGKPLGRPHLADAILAHPANQQKLRDEGICDKNSLFPPYLVPGAAGYVARSRPTVYEAIEVIHDAGGVAVWAHPFWDLDDERLTLDAIDRFADHGLDGVEVFYATHTEAQTRLLHEHCSAKGMLITGSTDFHGPRHERFNSFGAFETYGLEPELGPIGQAASNRSSR